MSANAGVCIVQEKMICVCASCSFTSIEGVFFFHHYCDIIYFYLFNIF